MKRARAKAILLTILVAMGAALGWASENSNDPASMGKPLSYWLRSIEDRDWENMEAAFQAIINLGSAAWPAVPQLTEIVGLPFTSIRINEDDAQTMTAKLADIQLRADAIEALASIGEAAAPSALTLINWGLTLRLAPVPAATPELDNFFIDLVIIDAMQRMRVAGAIQSFGPNAFPAVATLLRSPDPEGRKLAVAILGQNAPRVASVLSKAGRCDERKLGISMLVDMWPVVAREYLTIFKGMMSCGETTDTGH